MAYAKRITVSKIEEHSKGGSKFQKPPDIPVLWSPRRTTRNSKPLADDQDPNINDVPAYSNVTPTKSKKEMPKFKAPVISEKMSLPKAKKSYKRPHQSLDLGETDELGTGDMQSLLERVKTKSFPASKVPPFFDHRINHCCPFPTEAGSSSSLSTPATSPGKDSFECDTPKPYSGGGWKRRAGPSPMSRLPRSLSNDLSSKSLTTASRFGLGSKRTFAKPTKFGPPNRNG